MVETYPQFRILTKRCRDELAQLPAGLSEKKLHEQLTRIRYEYKAHLTARSSEVQDRARRHERFDSFREAMLELVGDWNELGQSELAEYVAHRKAVLGFLEMKLGIDGEGGYSREDVIHDLIFPMHSTSDETDSERWNLWVLDERLAFHEYLASDKSWSSNEATTATGRERPDIVVFDKPTAFAEGGGTRQTVTIIEFKRPMRSYQVKDNPIHQVLDYVRRLKSGTALDRRQRPVRSILQCFCYIVCDITNDIIEFAQNSQLKAAPWEGFFGYIPEPGAYIEIISFDHLIQRARMRNEAFFRKLANQG